MQADIISSFYSRVFLFPLSKMISMFCDDSNNISGIYCKPSSAIVALDMKGHRKPSISQNKQYTRKTFLSSAQQTPVPGIVYSAIS